MLCPFSEPVCSPQMTPEHPARTRQDRCWSQVPSCRWGNSCGSRLCFEAQCHSQFLLGVSSIPVQVLHVLPPVLVPGEGCRTWSGGQCWLLKHSCRPVPSTCPCWGWEKDLLGVGQWLRAVGVSWSAMIPSSGSFKPSSVHIPDPQPHALHCTPSSLSPCRQPPLPLSCPSISCLPPSRLLPSLSVPSSPQLQGGTLSTRLQSRPSRRSRSPRSRPPRPSPAALWVRAGSGQVGTVTCPCLWQGGSSRAGQGVCSCLLAWPKLVSTGMCRGLSLPCS